MTVFTSGAITTDATFGAVETSNKRLKRPLCILLRAPLLDRAAVIIVINYPVFAVFFDECHEIVLLSSRYAKLGMSDSRIPRSPYGLGSVSASLSSGGFNSHMRFINSSVSDKNRTTPFSISSTGSSA